MQYLEICIWISLDMIYSRVVTEWVDFMQLGFNYWQLGVSAWPNVWLKDLPWIWLANHAYAPIIRITAQMFCDWSFTKWSVSETVLWGSCLNVQWCSQDHDVFYMHIILLQAWLLHEHTIGSASSGKVVLIFDRTWRVERLCDNAFARLSLGGFWTDQSWG